MSRCDFWFEFGSIIRRGQGKLTPFGSYQTGNGSRNYCVNIEPWCMEPFAHASCELRSCGLCVLRDGTRIYSACIDGIDMLLTITDTIEMADGTLRSIIGFFDEKRPLIYCDTLNIECMICDVTSDFVVVEVNFDSSLGAASGAVLKMFRDGRVELGEREVQSWRAKLAYTKALTLGTGVVIK